MSIYKRYSKKKPKEYVWWTDFTTKSGKRIRQSTGTKNRAKAQQLHDKLKNDSWDESNLGIQTKRTWKEAAMWYLKARTHLKAYKSLVRNLRNLDPILSNKYLHEIDEDLIENFKDYRLNSTYKRCEDGESYSICKNTVNKDLQALRAVLNMAKKKKWVKIIPDIEMFELSDDEKERNVFLTHEEAYRLLNELQGQEQKHVLALVEFTLSTGLRESNVTRLTWDRVNLKRKFATVDASHSKNKKPIRVPLNDDAMKVLLKQKSKHPRYVFTYKNKPIKNANATAWRKALDRAGITSYYPPKSSCKGEKKMYPTKEKHEYLFEDFRWHDLRHTWATWHAEAGTQPEVIQKLGAWRTASMVQRYTHLCDDYYDPFANNISIRKKS